MTVYHLTCVAMEQLGISQWLRLFVEPGFGIGPFCCFSPATLLTCITYSLGASVSSLVQ